MLGYIFLAILLVNSISFAIVSRSHKELVDTGKRSTGPNGSTTYLLCGGIFPSRYENLEWILDSRILRGGVHILSYQNFGFDPRIVAEQLECDIRAKNRFAIFITTSVGSEIPFFMEKRRFAHVAIDPCLGRQSLCRSNSEFAHAVSIILEFVAFLLGWLSYLPVVKTSIGYCSLALFADSMYWATKNFKVEEAAIDGLVISTEDEVIDPDWAEQHIETDKEICKRKIPCRHTDMEIANATYATDLSIILGEVGNGFSRFC